MSTHKQYIRHQAEAKYMDRSKDQKSNRHKMPRNKQDTLTIEISSPETLANKHVALTCFNFGNDLTTAIGLG